METCSAVEKLSAPFPYFGGKSTVANEVWDVLGNVPHYIEPFFGSGAVLLARAQFTPSNHTETVCDKDGFLANVWRSIKFSPDEVAKWCDWPVNHADLSARRKTLIKNESRLLENLCSDEKWHDPVLAGYWVWAASCWIGSGLTRLGAIPHLGDGGKGVHTKGKIPDLTGGKGVHAKGQRPDIGNGGKGAPLNYNIYDWMNRLAERLRYVRVVCGDWTRVCGGNWQTHMGICGMFFDPPYAVENRDTNVYHHDSITVGKDVEKWCLERGALPDYRIVVAGYSDEYQSLVANGWRVHAWKSHGGYAKVGDGPGKENRHRETLFMSPHCLQAELF